MTEVSGSAPNSTINLSGAIAKTTLSVGLCAAAIGVIARDEQTFLGSMGSFVGALTAILLVGPIAESQMGRVIDHMAKMDDVKWKKFSNTRPGRVIAHVAAGTLAPLLVTIPVFICGVYAAKPLATEGPSLANVGMAMAGASAWVAVNTVLRRLKKVEDQSSDEPPTKPRAPRMR